MDSKVRIKGSIKQTLPQRWKLQKDHVVTGTAIPYLKVSLPLKNEIFKGRLLAWCLGWQITEFQSP